MGSIPSREEEYPPVHIPVSIEAFQPAFAENHAPQATLPPTAEILQLCALFRREIESAADKSANAVTEATGRLTEAVSQLAHALNTCKTAEENPQGLFHFREWWDLTQVTIRIDGTEISGIPIFVKGDTLRVVDQKHSYFIPLGKVEYIRTGDGFCHDEWG